ncbi:hypothetical protein AAC387_Pa01g3171 [Persea americana]
MAGPPLTKKIEKKHVKKIKRPQSNSKGSMKLSERMEAIGKSLFLLLDQFITETVAESIDAQIRERISKEMKKVKENN